MKGVNSNLEVFEDKLTITPSGVLGFLTKGLKGAKTIPFSSITAVQYRKAGPIVAGFIQFTIPGGNEGRGGVFDAVFDENTFMFCKSFDGRDVNEEAEKINNYIDSQIKLFKSPQNAQPAGIADELKKLADLRGQGVLSEEEFQQAKKKLLA